MEKTYERFNNGNSAVDWKECISRFSQNKVFVIGDVMLDQYQWGEVKRISPEAPVPVFHVTGKTTVLGGAANVAVNLAGLEVPVSLVGVRGKDRNGEELSRLLAKEGVTDLLMEMDQWPTITKTRVMAQNQQLFRIDEEHTASLPVESQKIILSKVKELVKEYKVVILSDYSKGMLINGLCQEVIELCRSLNMPAIVDPKREDWIRYRGATCITPNIQEFSQFVQTSVEKEAELIRKAQEVCMQLDLKYLLITRGAKGVVLVGQDNEPAVIPAKAREVYDVSGAGDTVVATLAAAVGVGISWIEAAQIANMAAGIVVGKLGTQPILKDELERLAAPLMKNGYGQYLVNLLRYEGNYA